jgi:hypothetical protein
MSSLAAFQDTSNQDNNLAVWKVPIHRHELESYCLFGDVSMLPSSSMVALHQQSPWRLFSPAADQWQLSRADSQTSPHCPQFYSQLRPRFDLGARRRPLEQFLLQFSEGSGLKSFGLHD